MVEGKWDYFEDEEMHSSRDKIIRVRQFMIQYQLFCSCYSYTIYDLKHKFSHF